jgi:hypothetical protein
LNGLSQIKLYLTAKDAKKIYAKGAKELKTSGTQMTQKERINTNKIILNTNKKKDASFWEASFILFYLKSRWGIYIIFALYLVTLYGSPIMLEANFAGSLSHNDS